MLKLHYVSDMLGGYTTIAEFKENLAKTCDLQIGAWEVWECEDASFVTLEANNTYNFADLNVTTLWFAKVQHEGKMYFAISPREVNNAKVDYYDCYLYKVTDGDDFDMYFYLCDFMPFITATYITNKSKVLFVACAKQNADVYNWEIDNVDTDVLKELDEDEPILHYAEGEPLDANVFKKYIEDEFGA